jgi:hypothetical protein
MYNNETKQNKFNITIDPRPVKSKPGDDYQKTITENLIIYTGITITEFSRYVTLPYSYTWSGGKFKGTRSNDTWLEQQVFALDFDDGTITTEEVIERLNQIGIYPQVWYSTFSDSPQKRKFRVVIFLDAPVTDKRTHKFIFDTLFFLFPEVDKQCRDASRYFFGGKDYTILYDEPISKQKFLDSLSIEMYSRDSRKFRNIPLISEDFSTDSVQNSAFQYNYYSNTQFSTIPINNPTTTLQGGRKPRIDFDELRKKARVFDEFMNGYWFHHDVLFGLATNLVQVDGGFQLMKETMERYNHTGQTEYTENNFNILPYVKKKNYPMLPIYSFSPFAEDDDLYDIITTTRDVRGYIEQVEPIVRIELEEAEKKMVDDFNWIMGNGETGKVYLMVMPTALGKTRLLTTSKATIATSTNSLKNEVGERMKIRYVATPDVIEFESQELKNKIASFYAIGLPKKAMQLLHHMIKRENADQYLDSDIEKAKNYLMELDEAKKSNEAILTSHKRAMFTDFGHDTLIYDEDPISSLLEIKQMKISELFALSMFVDEPELSSLVDYLKKTDSHIILDTPTFAIDINKLIDKFSVSHADSNVFEFFNSTYFMRDGATSEDRNSKRKDIIHYVVKRDLPKDKKVIIMSATASVPIYQKMFGDRLIIKNIGDVKQQGKIIQHTRRSCSRYGLNRYGKQISEEVGDLPVITFKTHGNLFNNPVEGIWFGNCSGYDRLKGQDMAVVGTPHINELQYLMIAKAIGIDVKTKDNSMTYQKVEYNGFRFMMKCYDNEDLRNIQLSMIEAELIQAVGRARTLRTSAQVDLYSNFPLKLSDEFRY